MPISNATSSGSMKLISTVTVGADTQTVSFTGLIGVKRYMYFIEWVSGATTNLALYVNGDTTATNYYRQDFLAGSTTLTGARNNDGYIAVTIDGTADASTIWGTCQIDGGGYWRTQNLCNYNDASVISITNRSTCKTATIASITQLDFVAQGANQIKAGTIISLYEVVK